MFKYLLSLLSCLALVSVSGCVTPNVTGPKTDFFTPAPPQADQYSDFLIGRFATLTNQSSLAAENASRAYKKSPENSFLLEQAVTSLLLAGEVDKAVDLAEFGLKHVKEIGSFTRLTLAAEDFRKERYTDASFRLENGELDIFNRMVAKSLSAWAAVGEGDPQKAKTNLIESLVGDNLYDGVNLYMLAFIQEATDQRREALGTFSIVWKERMRLAIAAEHYARLLAADSNTKGAYQIVSQYRTEIGPNPAVDDLAWKLENGIPVQAKTLSAREGAAVTLFSIGSALASQTKSDITTAYFWLALHADPELDGARTMLARSLSQAERQDDALNTLKTISKKSVYYSSARSQMGWVLMDLERDAEAIALVEDAYASTNDRDLAIQAGNLHYVSEQYPEALDWYNKIVEQDKADNREDWQVLYTRGLTYDALDRWGDAEKDLLKSISLDENRAEVLNYLGYSWVDRGVHLEKAFDYIKKAVALRPDSGAIVDSLGWAYFRLGKFDLAVQYLESAASLGTSDPVINDHLGDAYWRVGRLTEARYQWGHALKLETEDEKKLEIEAKLKSGLDAAKPVTPVKDFANSASTLP